MTWRLGYPCGQCGLPVLLTGDPQHPGYGVIDHVPGAAPRASGLPDLAVLHRFCRDVPADTPATCGVLLRRAMLGRATLQFDAGEHGGDDDIGLGLSTGRAESPARFGKLWRVRKMRCATVACRYYAPRAVTRPS